MGSRNWKAAWLATAAWTGLGVLLWALFPMTAAVLLPLCSVAPLAWIWVQMRHFSRYPLSPTTAALGLAAAYLAINASWSLSPGTAAMAVGLVLLMVPTLHFVLNALPRLEAPPLAAMASGALAGLAAAGVLLCVEVFSDQLLRRLLIGLVPALQPSPNHVVLDGGQVTGLAWTEVGGELLTIETVTMPGKGKTITTGKLGEVMQESIQAALSVVRNRSRKLGVQEDFYQKNDIHIHLPEGATPKDGPSAGIGIATAMVSVLTGIPVRADVAMTGEITLRGEVLQIGGLKEKLLAAHRGAIKTVLIPDENVKDLVDIPDNVKNRLEIIPVKWIDKVLEVALERTPEPLPERAEAAPLPPAEDKPGSTTAVKH